MFIRRICLVCLLATFPFAQDVSADAFGLTFDSQVGLNAYAALVDREFEHARDELRIVAAGKNATSGKWDDMKAMLAIVAKSDPAFAAVWFARPDGSYFTVDAGPESQTLKNRDYFPALMAGKDVIGNLVISKSTGKRSAIVAVPVRMDGRVIGAVGVSIAMEKVAAFVEDRLAFPKDVMFYALDSHGRIALHRESTLLFEFAAQLGSPTLTQAVKEMLSKPQGMVRYRFEGAQRTAIFKRSSAIDWVYALRR